MKFTMELICTSMDKTDIEEFTITTQYKQRPIGRIATHVPRN